MFFACAGLACGIVAPSTVAEAGLTGRYYFSSGTNRLATFRAKQIDPNVNFFFGTTGPAALPGRSANFGVVWQGYLVPSQAGTYRLGTCTDDGVRVFLDGEALIDRFQDQGLTLWQSREVALTAGKKYKIRMEFYQGGGPSGAHLLWTTSGSFPWNDGMPCVKADGQTDQQFESQLTSLAIPSSVLQDDGDSLENLQASCEMPRTMLRPEQAPSLSHPNTKSALQLFRRLAGYSTSHLDSRILAMKLLIDQGKPKEAARIASEDPSFLDVTVRQMAAKISTRDQVPTAPLNDFIATYVGITRDRIDARKLLTGSFLYRMNRDVRWTDDSIYGLSATVSSNRHYQEIENSRIPLKCSLDKVPSLSAIPSTFRQKVRDKDAGLRDHPEPAGVLSSRAFAEAHLVAGTNRRAVEKAFEHFLCAPIDEWRDANAPDERVGRDVTRFPSGGNNLQYQTECKSCHGGMDALRGAFAHWNYDADRGFMKYAPYFNRTTGNNEGENSIRKDHEAAWGSVNVVTKMNHNIDHVDFGFTVRDNSFINYSNERANRDRFGFTSNLSGKGVAEFGRMIANSAAFPRCQAMKVFQEICKKDPKSSPATTEWLNEVGDIWARNGYDMRDLFETIATQCMQEAQ